MLCQPGLVADSVGELYLLPPYNQAKAVRGLTEFSHIWLLFFINAGGRLVANGQAPRLGGNSRMGVRHSFASPPQSHGMSLVGLKGITLHSADVILRLDNLDLLDGTPVVDIKFYLPYVERLPDARAGFTIRCPLTPCR